MTMLTQLADVARRTGYPVVEVAGWKSRTTKDAKGRPERMSDVRTITCHHTANGGAPGNYPSLRVVRDGRSGLPGPLAHYGIGLDGTIYVIAAGKCNHAGVSKSVDYLNSHAIGIEAEAVGVPGTPGDWPPAQMESYQRLCAALADEFPGVGVSDVRGHKETCAPPGRKSDPDFDMPTHRRHVAAVDLSKPPKELPMSAAEVKEIKAAINAATPSADEIAKALIKALRTEPLVPNKPTAKALADAKAAGKPVPPTTFFTLADALANIEGDDDNRFDTLFARLDAIVTLLEASAPPAPPAP